MCSPRPRSIWPSPSAVSSRSAWNACGSRRRCARAKRGESARGRVADDDGGRARGDLDRTRRGVPGNQLQPGLVRVPRLPPETNPSVQLPKTSARGASSCSPTAVFSLPESCPSSARLVASRYAISSTRFASTTAPRDSVRQRDAFARCRGQPVRGGGPFVDITERKKAEQQRQLLLAELNHRVKNTLATVISIAQQSFSGNPNLDEARRSFARGFARWRKPTAAWRKPTGRGSLSRRCWVTSSLRIFGRTAECARVRSTDRLQCQVRFDARDGDYELVTNAAKHGASRPKAARSRSLGRSTLKPGGSGSAGPRAAVQTSALPARRGWTAAPRTGRASDLEAMSSWTSPAKV